MNSETTKTIAYTLALVMGCGTLIFIGVLVYMFVQEVIVFERARRK